MLCRIIRVLPQKQTEKRAAQDAPLTVHILTNEPINADLWIVKRPVRCAFVRDEGNGFCAFVCGVDVYILPPLSAYT